jgi:hypothetical protein
MFTKAAFMAAIFTTMIFGQATAQGGNKMKVIELIGSFEEIGFNWGKQLKSEIDTAFQIEIEGTAKFFGIDTNVLIEQAGKLIPAAREFDPDFITVLEGMAKGSGRTFEEIFTLRALLE